MWRRINFCQCFDKNAREEIRKSGSIEATSEFLVYLMAVVY